MSLAFENKKKVAVLICVYSGDNPDFLYDALDSLRAQTFLNFDVFLYVDGQIPDSLEAVIERFGNLGSAGLKLTIGDVQRGLAYGLNVLIDKATEEGSYEYFARMDADDICLPERLERQVSFLEKNKCISICGTSVTEFLGDRDVIQDVIMKRTHDQLIASFARSSPFRHPTVMFRRAVFDQGYRYDSDFQNAQDYELWIRVAVAGFKFANIEESLLMYRFDDKLKQRRSFSRLLNEIKLKTSAIQGLRLSKTNYLFVLGIIVLRLSPPFVAKYAYRYLR